MRLRRRCASHRIAGKHHAIEMRALESVRWRSALQIASQACLRKVIVQHRKNSLRDQQTLLLEMAFADAPKYGFGSGICFRWKRVNSQQRVEEQGGAHRCYGRDANARTQWPQRAGQH